MVAVNTLENTVSHQDDVVYLGRSRAGLTTRPVRPGPWPTKNIWPTKISDDVFFLFVCFFSLNYVTRHVQEGCTHRERRRLARCQTVIVTASVGTM